MKKKILLIATGGTIASKATAEGLSPGITSEELLQFVPEIKDYCDVDTKQILSIDSTNIQPEHWVLMAETIRDCYDCYDGFVITHGTDTMAYSSAALSYLIQNPDKPIVFTGSQKPINVQISDAGKNLLDSFRFACESENKGVYIVFSGIAIVGTRAKKTKSKSYDAFESINYPVAAFIDDHRIVRYMKQENSGGTVRFYNKIAPKVFLLKLIPGIEPVILDYICEMYDAVVIESYGVGGLPFADRRNFFEKLENLTKNGKIVVIATQVVSQGSDMGIYEVGFKAMSKYNVLQAYDMTVETAVTKLMWLLAEYDSYSDIEKGFYTKINDDILL